MPWKVAAARQNTGESMRFKGGVGLRVFGSTVGDRKTRGKPQINESLILK